MNTRLQTLLSALDEQMVFTSTSAAITRVASYLDAGGTPELWLTWSVLRGQLPTSDEMIRARRDVRLETSESWIKGLLRRRNPRPVRVITRGVIVDVHHTSTTRLATGIQRVVRNTIQNWVRDHTFEMIGWSNDFHSARLLALPEQENALFGNHSRQVKTRQDEFIVPWKSTYILPELAIEGERVERIRALAEYSGNTTAAIGYDCVPLTTAETVGSGMGASFSRYLTAVAQMDSVATISSAATIEYEGWRRMLRGAGLSGPAIKPVVLPIQAKPHHADGLDAARTMLAPDGLPLVLVVGSHEPRKNHLAILTAVEQLWRAGRKFNLVFIGGNAWGSDEFTSEIESLSRGGRPVRTIAAVNDQLLWSAYQVAAVTVFPSLNEGFGLPVAESLAAGTPVITSNYGSMREIARHGGALLVDPRNDVSISEALENVLFDPTIAQRLEAEAAAIPTATWADYSAALWNQLVPQARI